ncbi:MAG: hypothetical protein JST39_18565 [Bacteroidetes bacterium]|nr:hypothetical protein [Bacteroidota bacterium]
MELELFRTYYATGTNGELFHQGRRIALTIELPWKDNHTGVSCIPEGRYELLKRYSPHFKWHLQVADVPGRQDILIHPANNALKELRGCIAPVFILHGAGRGLLSRMALAELKTLAFDAIDRNETVFLTIKNKEQWTSSPASPRQRRLSSPG